MKFKFTILLGLTTLLAGAAQIQAQENNQISNLASPKEIAPPAYALNRIPKGGKSRFYGAAFFGVPLGEEVRIHFYQWPQLNPPPVNFDGRRFDSDQNYRVDIFVRKQKKGAQFHLTQSVDVESSSFDMERFEFNYVELSANYLVPKRPEIPMFYLKCTVYGGFSFGTDIIMVFTEGWNQKPYVKTLYFYGNHSDSIDNSIDLDERGVTEITRLRGFVAADASITEYWPWNGEKFVHTEDKVVGSDVTNPGMRPAANPDE